MSNNSSRHLQLLVGLTILFLCFYKLMISMVQQIDLIQDINI